MKYYHNMRTSEDSEMGTNRVEQVLNVMSVGSHCACHQKSIISHLHHVHHNLSPPVPPHDVVHFVQSCARFPWQVRFRENVTWDDSLHRKHICQIYSIAQKGRCWQNYSSHYSVTGNHRACMPNYMWWFMPNKPDVIGPMIEACSSMTRLAWEQFVVC